MGLDLAQWKLEEPPDLKPKDGCRRYHPAHQRQTSLMLLRLNEGEIPAAKLQNLREKKKKKGKRSVAVVSADEFLWAEG